jgi:hypothetical protein
VTAPAELVIEVTADDIASGIGQDCAKCPIALAAARLYPMARIYVGGELTREISAYWPEAAFYEMPDEAVDFTLAFDCDEPVAPFTFTARLTARSGGAS